MGYLILALKILSYVIIGDAILSWIVPSRDRFPRNLTSKICEPIYRPIHKLIDPAKMGGFDIAPLIVLIAIQILTNVIIRWA